MSHLIPDPLLNAWPRPPGSTEDPPDTAEQTGVLGGHDAIELTDVQPHPLAARATCRARCPDSGRESAPRRISGIVLAPRTACPRVRSRPPGPPFVESLPLSLELESGEVFAFVLGRLPRHRRDPPESCSV